MVKVRSLKNSEYVKNQGVKSIVKDRTVMGILFAVLSGFVLSLAQVVGFPAAYNAAVAVIFPSHSLEIFMGSVLSYAVTGTLDNGIVQLCVILAVWGLYLVNPLERYKDEPLYKALLCTVLLFLFGCAMSAASLGNGFSVSVRMINALMCGCFVFAAQTVLVNKNKRGVYDLTGLSGVYAGIIYVICVSALSAIPLPKVNAGRIICVISTLFMARKYKSSAGAAAGSLGTVGMLIFDPAMSKNTLILAVGGLISGAFNAFGIVANVAAFLAVCMVGLIAVGTSGDTFPMFADVIIGSALYVLIPSSFVGNFAKKVVGMKGSADVIGQATSSKLSYASKTIGGIKEQLYLVTDAVQRQCEKDLPSSRTMDRICHNCDMYNICFMKKGKTERAFSHLDKICENFNGISMEDVKSTLPSCTEKKNLCKCFNESWEEIISQRAVDMKTGEMRKFLIAQLSCMEDILRDLSFRTSDVRQVNSQLSSQVKSYFSDLGYNNVKASVYSDKNLCTRADIYLTAEFKGDLVKTTAGISAVLDCDMGLPVICRENNLCRISFCEEPVFSVEIGTFSASAGGEFSGDGFEIADGCGNEKYIIFSDGMGTGKRAMLDSAFTVRLVSRLLKSGMEMSTVHRLVNSVLMVKGWEESFATLDILRLDLNGGSGDFLKAGASQSILCRDGGIMKIGGQSFPVGILNCCPPDENSLKLFDGDIIFMYSDGAEDSNPEKLAEYPAENPFLSSKEIAENIGRKILENKVKDDVTLLILKIHKI